MTPDRSPGRARPHLAVFVSPHGFGHAARASAVMEALHRRHGVRFEVFTTAPRWLFDESVSGLYRYHEVSVDVGFVQRSALTVDVEGTVRALEAMVPFDDDLVAGLALEVKRAGCTAVLCDIAPLGIAVAERAGLPSILVQNFTWTWLYEPLMEEAPSLAALGDALDRWVDKAHLHLLAEPFCARDPRAHGEVLPVSRPPVKGRAEIREELGLGPQDPVVVVTVGGYPEAMPFLHRLSDHTDITFLVTGAHETRREGRIHLFDNGTHLYMPHLVRAADAVVAKLGYSTVAEVWREGRPLATVTREDFREMEPLQSWVEARLPGFRIPAADFAGGAWLDRIPELLARQRPPAQPEGGADQVVTLMEERGLLPHGIT